MTDIDEDDTRAFSDTSGVGGCLLWLAAIAITVGVLWWFNS